MRWFERQCGSSEDAGMLWLVPEATNYYPANPVSCSVYQNLQVHGYTADSGLALPRQLQIQVHVATMQPPCTPCSIVSGPPGEFI